MRFVIYTAAVFAMVIFAGGAIAGGSKGKKVDITFHIETEATDNPRMIFTSEVMGHQKFFRRIPEVSSKDFVAFSPFPSDDQSSYGVILQLKDSARGRLEAVTRAYSGKWLISKAFGRIIDGVLIEDPVTDGLVVVWNGLTIEEIKQIDEYIPRIGEKKK